MNSRSSDCNVSVIGAGPYGLSSAAYLRAAGVDVRIFGEPMSFWEMQMPAGMYLRSNWSASHIADPMRELTLDHFCRERGNHITRPIPRERFVEYGHWFQQKAVPHVERRKVIEVRPGPRGFEIRLDDGEEFATRAVVCATGINRFVNRPVEFSAIPATHASHTSEHNNLGPFGRQRVVIIGGGQSALESAALLKEGGAEVEVVARQSKLNWVGLHSNLHRLGLISALLYSDRDVGPAGISRLVAAPHVFRLFPREFQNRTGYRAIRPAGAGWLKPRLSDVSITLGRRAILAKETGSRVWLKLDDHTERLVDHVLLATGFRVDVSRYEFLSPALSKQLKVANGFPVLKRGLESSIKGLYFVGKPASYSFGPLLGFVSGAEFASTEVVRSVIRKNDSQ